MKLNEIEITDFNAPELDIYARCNEAQLLHYFEPNPGIFIAESPKVIERALNAGYAPISFLAEKRLVSADGGETRQLLEKYPDVPVFTAEYNVLTKLTGFALTRGMLCAMKRNVLPSVEDICKHANRIAILEDVVNPTNVGAIIRSAAALGMDAVLLTHGCADPLYRRASRVSMGTVFQIPWTILPKNSWPDASMDTLKALGFKTAAMALKTDSVSIDDPVLTSHEKLAIVLGTEGEGLKDATIAACDYTVLIPMFHGRLPECGSSQCCGFLAAWTEEIGILFRSVRTLVLSCVYNIVKFVTICSFFYINMLYCYGNFTNNRTQPFISNQRLCTRREPTYGSQKSHTTH